MQIADTQIFRENKLHIVSVTDSFVGSVYGVSVMEHSLKMDVVLNNFPIPQEGFLETDF